MEIYSRAEELLSKSYPGLRILRNESMKNHTSFKIGGVTPFFAVPSTQEEFVAVYELFKAEGIKPLVMGNGTNLLIEDGYLEFPVIMTHGGFSGISKTGDYELEAQAGATLARIAVFAMNCGLGGLEFAHGIPGTLGGGIFMNAGAYGGELKDVVTEVSSYNKSGTVETFTGDNLCFSYRHSVFSENGNVILGCKIMLKPADRDDIKAHMEELAQKRRQSQPLDMPSAGSTFKRPKTGYAAALIDQCGLKGFTVGGAQVSEKHAGFVVNIGNATFEDVYSLMGQVKEKVYADTGVVLEPEVRIIRRGGVKD